MVWFASNLLFSKSSSDIQNQGTSESSVERFVPILDILKAQEVSLTQNRRPVIMENYTDMIEIPPPYDPKYNSSKPNVSYSYRQQLIDKFRDTTSRLGYQDQSKPMVDRKSISQGMKLVGIAVEEFESGNEAVGLDVYLSGLDKIIMSLPNLKESKTKEALKEKLLSLEERIGIQTQLKLFQEEQMNARNGADLQNNSLVCKLNEISQLVLPSWLLSMINRDDHDKDDPSLYDSEGSLFKFKRLSRAITDMIVRCVVIFKQSPIPGLLYLIFSYFMHLILWFEHQFNIIEKMQNIGIGCIKLVLRVDEKYHLHEYASEALYSIVSALLRAIVAYKVTRPLNDTNTVNQNQHVPSTGLWIWPKYIP